MTRLYPQFRQVPIVQEWGGYIDVTPDVVPFISGVGDLPGLTVATGFSGHGFGIGPGAGQLAAELATEEKTSVETTPFRISRFSDGSRIIIGPEI
jgi:glycine/D-amino acid oxidase-like deaminating enzyme